MIDQTKITDAYGVPELFAESIGRIEQIGPNRRLTFVTRNGMTPTVYDPVVKLVISAEALLDLAQLAAADRPQPPEFAAMSVHQRAN